MRFQEDFGAQINLLQDAEGKPSLSIAANYIDDVNLERGKLEATLASLGGAGAEQEAAAAVAAALADLLSSGKQPKGEL